jgi:transcriptional regulator with XRE-family HTH domain
MATQIQIMQDNLCDLRKIAGWTAETLAGKLGITKQTISNLENAKVKLSRVQYIAIRAVFECEAATNSDNTTLRKVMRVLFHAMAPVYETRKEQIRTAMISIASISSAGITGLQLYSSATALLASLGSAAIQATEPLMGEPSLGWLLDLLQEPDPAEKEINESMEDESDENS